ncbi:MAG TPA: hypothetical protein H9694_05190 [Firmicutes bacterium]|nr:hypothetical protein [Bacillota bacterium]
MLKKRGIGRPPRAVLRDHGVSRTFLLIGMASFFIQNFLYFVCAFQSSERVFPLIGGISLPFAAAMSLLLLAVTAALLILINNKRLAYGFKRIRNSLIMACAAAVGLFDGVMYIVAVFLDMPGLVPLEYLFLLAVLPLMVTPLAAFLVGLPINIAMRRGKKRG